MRFTALLPMKGHSERVPRKNTRSFAGRPLYHAVMDVLLACSSIDLVVVNTDCEAIADDIRRFYPSVLIHWRPEDICGDCVSMNTIIDYDLSKLAGEHFLQTHSTNPLITQETISNALETYCNKQDTCDSLFTVTEHRTRLYREDGTPLNHNPRLLLRTQDLPALYEENSCLYVFSKNSFAESGGYRIGQRPYMFVMDKLEAQDIDTLDEFIIAEALYSLRQG